MHDATNETYSQTPNKSPTKYMKSANKTLQTHLKRSLKHQQKQKQNPKHKQPANSKTQIFFLTHIEKPNYENKHHKNMSVNVLNLHKNPCAEFH
jgi:hypothetical protein